MALLPVKSSAPAMMTSISPTGNINPDSNLGSTGFCSEIPGKP